MPNINPQAEYKKTVERCAIVCAMVKGDDADYRAMRARERYASTRTVPGCKARIQESAVRLEMAFGDTLRGLYEAGRIA